ncbi:MAG: GNAT family N-acetyltransferase [Solirubrobacterales bacterium]
MVRPAREDEVERVLGMYEWMFEPPGYLPQGWDAQRAKGALTEAIEAEDSAVLVAEHRGELLGFVTAYLELNSVRFGLRCWVEDLAVEPQRRSEGIGGRLLDAAAEWARGRGATHLELDTGLAREDAQRFYERREPAAKGYSYSWRL